MINYRAYSTDELMQMLGDKINEFTTIYFESSDVKAIRRLKNRILELKKEINARIRREKKEQHLLKIKDLGLHRSGYRNTTV